MSHPQHPGALLRDELTTRLGLTVTEAAEQLGITRAALSRVLNCRAAISPEMAIRLEMWLGMDCGRSANDWITRQSVYDLWKARRCFKYKIKRCPLSLNFSRKTKT